MKKIAKQLESVTSERYKQSDIWNSCDTKTTLKSDVTNNFCSYIQVAMLVEALLNLWIMNKNITHTTKKIIYLNYSYYNQIRGSWTKISCSIIFSTNNLSYIQQTQTKFRNHWGLCKSSASWSWLTTLKSVENSM